MINVNINTLIVIINKYKMQLINTFIVLALLVSGVDSKRVKYTKHSKSKFPTKFSPVKKAKLPTDYTIDITPDSPVDVSDISNCLEWTCTQWCYLYDETKNQDYIRYGCVDDGEYCKCE